MIRELLKKLLRPSPEQADREIGDVRAEALDKAEALTPGHSDRSASIGVFHN